MSDAGPVQLVDAEHPWLGLSPFTEATARFFFGRDRDLRDLGQRVAQNRLTVQYGPSGLGKSSILGAGLIPWLRQKNFQPCILRLDHSPGAKPLSTQAIDAVRALLPPAPAGATPVGSGTFWELLHYLPGRHWDPLTVKPVLIIDQFEEIFTLTDNKQRDAERLESAAAKLAAARGADEAEVMELVARRDAARALARRARAEVEDFFSQLSDVVENQPPPAVEERIRDDRSRADDYDFSASSVRIVLTLREEYLSPLEAWRNVLPSLMSARLALAPLTGPQALEVVVQPGRIGGGELVSAEVAAQIVCVVAKRAAGTPLAEIGSVSPPLLSLLCYELNEARVALGATTITARQVDDQSANILQNFYDRSFQGLPPVVRRVVEDRLISSGGHRNSPAREDLVKELCSDRLSEAEAGAALDQLVQGRLLSSDDRGGTKRLEITHDVLAPLVVRSRNERKAREEAELAKQEAERARLLAKETAERARREAAQERARLLEKEAADRANREADEQSARLRRTRRALAAVAVFVVVALGLAWWGWSSAKAARELLLQTSRSDFASAETMMGNGKWQDSVAYLARAIRYDPKNRNAHDALWLTLAYGERTNFPQFTLTHEDQANGVEFSPDGTRLLTFSDDGTARIWDAATGKPIDHLSHREEVMSAHFSPDGTRIVTASFDHTARVWNTATGGTVGATLEHAGPVYQANFSPDGTRIATASFDHTAQIWDAATGQKVGAPMQHGDSVLSACFSPDGKHVITASTDRTAQVWDATTGSPIGPRLPHTDKVIEASFSPDGTLVVTASLDSTARVWNAASGQPLAGQLQHKAPVFRARFSPDGTLVVTASTDRTAQVWRAVSGAPVGNVLRHHGDVNSAEFSSDGLRVVTASSDQTGQIWDATSGQPIGGPLVHSGTVLGAGFSPDGARVATASADHTVRVWDSATGYPAGLPMPAINQSIYAEFSRDGARILAVDRGATTGIWDAATGLPLGHALRHADKITTAHFSPDGARIVTASDDKTAQIWDAGNGRPVGEPLKLSAKVTGAQFSPDSTRVLTNCEDGTAQVWDAATWRPIGAAMTHKGPVTSARLSSDGKYVVTGSKDGTARIWDAASGLSISRPLALGDSCVCVEFSPDGNLVAGSSRFISRTWTWTATGEAYSFGKELVSQYPVSRVRFSPNSHSIVIARQDRAALVYSQFPDPVSRPLYHEENVNDAQFSPDGDRIVTASGDSTARIWDMTTGQPVGPRLPHRETVNTAQFSPDGQRVLTASDDGTARLWDTATHERLDSATAELLANFCSGATLDPYLGTLEVIDDAKRRKIWQRLEPALAKYPDWLWLAKTYLPQSDSSRVFLRSACPRREVATRLIRTKSQNCIEEAMSIDPRHPLLQIAAAVGEKNPVRAGFLRDYGIRRLPDDAQVWRAATELLLVDGDKPRATLTLEKATRLEPNSPELPALKKALAEMP